MNSGRFCIAGKFFVAIFTFICVSVVASCSAAQFEWKTARPESKGLSAKKLNSLKKSLAARNTTLVTPTGRFLKYQAFVIVCFIMVDHQIAAKFKQANNQNQRVEYKCVLRYFFVNSTNYGYKSVDSMTKQI